MFFSPEHLGEGYFLYWMELFCFFFLVSDRFFFSLFGATEFDRIGICGVVGPFFFWWFFLAGGGGGGGGDGGGC